jgi:hypothetical protein
MVFSPQVPGPILLVLACCSLSLGGVFWQFGAADIPAAAIRQMLVASVAVPLTAMAGNGTTAGPTGRNPAIWL